MPINLLKFFKARRRADNGSAVSGQQRRNASTSGTSALEFAFVLPMFVLLVLGIVDFSRLFYTELTLQNAVRQAGRFAITGNHLANPQNPGTSQSRVQSITQIAQNAAIGLSVSAIQISSAAGGSGSAGGPQDTVTISLTENLKLLTPLIGHFFPNNTYTFTVSAAFKNEPFPPSMTN